MSYFNFYAVQIKRLQQFLKEPIKYLGKDMFFVHVEVAGTEHLIPREHLRKLNNLPKIALTLKT